MPQRVVGGDSSAQQRRRFGVLQTFRYRRQRLHGSHHVLLVSTVIADAANFQVPAIAEISAPALPTRVVLAAVPADADTLPLLPCGNTVAHFIDDACHFMSGNARILNSRPQAFFREHVTVANAAGLHLDPHLSCIRLRNLALDDLEICSGFGNLRHLHLCHLHWYYSVGCHKFSYEFSVERRLPPVCPRFASVSGTLI